MHTLMIQDNIKEKRKYWPFIGLIYVILSPFLLVNLVTFVGAPQPLYFSWAIFWMIANLIFFFSLWMCAYRKPGTKLMTVYLWIAPLIWLNILIQLCGISLDNQEMNLLGLRFGLDFYTEKFNSYPVSYLRHSPWTIKTLFYTTTHSLLFLTFYYFSYCLRKRNERFKLMNQIDMDTSNSIQALYKEVDIDYLNKKYLELITQWPKFESVISYHYKLCKTRLEKKDAFVRG